MNWAEWDFAVAMNIYHQHCMYFLSLSQFHQLNFNLETKSFMHYVCDKDNVFLLNVRHCVFLVGKWFEYLLPSIWVT
jgi:hypothetical protein